jgi:hypothetical protein
MRDAPPLERLSKEPSPAAEPDFESFYLTHQVRLFRALVVVTRDVGWLDLQPPRFESWPRTRQDANDEEGWRHWN